MFLFVFSDMCKLDLQRARKSDLQHHKRIKARDANSNFLCEYGPTITLRNEVYFLLVAAKVKEVADLQIAKDVQKKFVNAEKQAARESTESFTEEARQGTYCAASSQGENGSVHAAYSQACSGDHARHG